MHLVYKSENPQRHNGGERRSTGLEPYLALEPRSKSPVRLSNPRARTGAIVAIVIAMLTYAAIGWLAGWLS